MMLWQWQDTITSPEMTMDFLIGKLKNKMLIVIFNIKASSHFLIGLTFLFIQVQMTFAMKFWYNGRMHKESKTKSC